MLKLIRLEWKKNNIIKYVRSAFIMAVILLILILASAGELEAKDTELAYGKSMLKAGVEMFTNMSFIIFTSTMLASFIVGAYKNKTMNLMFSYPISRKENHAVPDAGGLDFQFYRPFFDQAAVLLCPGGRQRIRTYAGGRHCPGQRHVLCGNSGEFSGNGQRQLYGPAGRIKNEILQSGNYCRGYPCMYYPGEHRAVYADREYAFPYDSVIHIRRIGFPCPL